MKVKELYSAAVGLIFGDNLKEEDNARFYASANRAILQIAGLFPLEKSFTVYHDMPKNLIRNNSPFEPVLITEDQPRVYFGYNAKAFYFECDAPIGTDNCSAYIEVPGSDDPLCLIQLGAESSDNNDYTVGALSTDGFRYFKGFVKSGGNFTEGCASIRFTAADTVYNVRCVAMYEHIRSISKDKIPSYTPYVSYDLRELVPDFMSFAQSPEYAMSGESLSGSEYSIIGDDILLLPYTVKGSVRVFYNHLPLMITSSNDPSEDNAVIDLSQELASLMPELIASYMWFEDEQKKSEYYRKIFNQRVAEVHAVKKNHKPGKMHNVYGW